MFRARIRIPAVSRLEGQHFAPLFTSSNNKNKNNNNNNTLAATFFEQQ
jgi:hypothetical protein